MSARKTNLPGLAMQAPTPPAIVLATRAHRWRPPPPAPSIPHWELAAENAETDAKAVIIPGRICSCPGFDAAEHAAKVLGRAGALRRAGAAGAP